MKVLVTGVAGFVGSHIAQTLLGRGDEVLGIDAMTSYYNIEQKRSNLVHLRNHPSFSFVEVDLRTAPLQEWVDGCDAVVHQAAQPGVRASWGSFDLYVEHNILSTQRILDAARSADVRKFIYASSSSVYGNAPIYPTREDQLPQPHSPYGVTKLSAEHLVRLFGQNWGLPTISLRYFTVYGPRQRPDMAMHRLIDAAITGKRFPLYGDGSQIRDFTYVQDVVDANLRALDADLPPGEVFNIAGGGSIAMKPLIDLVGYLSESEVKLEILPMKAGDVLETGGDITAAQKHLAWQPRTSIEDGLRLQIDWQWSNHKSRNEP